MIDVSILIVCYNSLTDIKNCLKGLYEKTKDVNFEVLLLDNSHDGTVEWVKGNYCQVRIIPNSTNLGFAGGNNLLAQHATGHFLLLLNPDTLITDNSVANLLLCAKKHPKHGAWGGITLYLDGLRENSSLQVSPTLWNMFLLSVGLKSLRKGFLRERGEREQEVAILSGAFMLVERKIWNEIGGFDTSFFLYSEEVDLCFRIAQYTGMHPIMTPHASVIHLVGKSCDNKKERMFGILRGQMHFDRKRHGILHNITLAALIVSNALIRWLISILLRPLIGKERAQRLHDTYKPIILNISEWWYGYTRHKTTTHPFPK
ncbi:MAG TPA: glycosyltransferase family 2 protein [Clostridiales bacterium]|nr:glycosyltransferase family 2 protein [Clostridiales bacterium]